MAKPPPPPSCCDHDEPGGAVEHRACGFEEEGGVVSRRDSGAGRGRPTPAPGECELPARGCPPGATIRQLLPRPGGAAARGSSRWGPTPRGRHAPRNRPRRERHRALVPPGQRLLLLERLRYLGHRGAGVVRGRGREAAVRAAGPPRPRAAPRRWSSGGGRRAGGCRPGPPQAGSSDRSATSCRTISRGIAAALPLRGRAEHPSACTGRAAAPVSREAREGRPRGESARWRTPEPTRRDWRGSVGSRSGSNGRANRPSKRTDVSIGTPSAKAAPTACSRPGERGAARVERDHRGVEQLGDQLGEGAAGPDLDPEIGQSASRCQGLGEAHRRGDLPHQQVAQVVLRRRAARR